MKNVVLIVVCAVAFAMCGQQANAQYPQFPQYPMNGAGYGYGGHHSHHAHHDYHYSAPVPNYQQNYNLGYGSYGIGNALPSVYGSNYSYPQYAPPVVPTYYQNNYYERPSHSHHSWHLGHYLMGHH